MLNDLSERYIVNGEKFDVFRRSYVGHRKPLTLPDKVKTFIL